MNNTLTVGLIRGSLPTYFPERYGVWTAAESALEALCDAEGVRLHIAPGVPMNERDTRAALDSCRAEGADFILLLHGGFTMGDVARTIAAAPVRAGFWSVPEPRLTGDIQLNTFVSLNMSLSIARQVRDLRAAPVQWYRGAPDAPDLVQRLRTTLRALRAAKALEGARIGIVGGLAMTFYNMEVSTNALRQRLGVDIAHHDMRELTQGMAAQDGARVAAEVAAMRAAAPVDGVTDAQMALTGRAALTLRDIANENGYHALAVSDWPALQDDPGMHPGAAFSWMEETDELPVASEGDALGAVTQLVAKALSGRVGYLLDMAEPDPEAGQILMWHGGGGPLHFADEAGARWVNHPTLGRAPGQNRICGTIADLVFRDGPVTVFRVARDAAALFEMTAESRRRDPSGFTGCRGWIESFRIAGEAASLDEVVATVMAHGLEHHFILIPGDEAAVLAEFASWTGMERLAAKPMRNHLAVADFS